MLSRVTPLRVLRLCLKELRESLRDRRTIVTLVLMPLLVYPLLSLVLNRVLLTSATTKSENFVTIGIGEELRDTEMTSLLSFGYFLVADRDTSAVYLESVVEDGKPRSSSSPLPSALPSPQVLPLSSDGREALRNKSVDLVITRVTPEQSSSDEVVEDTDGRTAEPKRTLQSEGAAATAKRYADVESMPEGYDPARIRELTGQLEIRFRKGDWRSERALQLVERILATLNNETAHTLLGGTYDAPFRVLATPVQMRSSYADALSTMIPLVLVLMTMAGAVYPAIDLTAGERERGTMEALIISPMPSYILLLAKYSAVVTVALLTALANLLAMTVTLWVSGIGALIFGEGTLSTSTIGTVLVLLVLFTMFFAALLLAVTSFAKSFKEAQAYLIPLMLLALTPGVMSLLPGIKFTTVLATVPLVNIVLLAREVLVDNAQWSVAMVAVICNGVYALAALAVASRLFGSDASMHGSKGSWNDLVSRPSSASQFPTVDQMAMTMALMFPLYFISSTSLGRLEVSFASKLAVSAVVSFVLIMGLPLVVALYRRIRITTTFRLAWPSKSTWLMCLPALVLVAGSAWMFAHEIIIAAQNLGIATISEEQFSQVAKFKDQLNSLPLPFILFVFAITPAVCEEFLFRGFVLNALQRRASEETASSRPRYSNWGAILLSAALFGLMHVLTSQVLAVERFAPTTFMGIILGMVAVRTGSIWPGIFLHALHNGLLLCMAHFSEQLEQNGVLIDESQHLPPLWLAGGFAAFAAGMTWLWYGSRTALEGGEGPGGETAEVNIAVGSAEVADV